MAGTLVVPVFAGHKELHLGPDMIKWWHFYSILAIVALNAIGHFVADCRMPSAPFTFGFGHTVMLFCAHAVSVQPSEFRVIR